MKQFLNSVMETLLFLLLTVATVNLIFKPDTLPDDVRECVEQLTTETLEGE